MKKHSTQLLVLAGFLLFILSCKKDLKTEPQGPPLPGDLELIDAQIVIPSGSNYNLNGHEIFHQAHSLPVSQDGKTRVIKPAQNVSIAYLLNADNKVVMAGFITDSTSTISVESTAKVVLYFALGIPFKEDTVTHIFLNRSNEVPGIQDWLNDFTQAWKADPFAFSSGSYRTKLSAWLEAKNEEMPPAGGRVGSVNVDANDVRSGLRLSSTGLGISITNTYRRRGAAFFYKMGHKLVGNNAYQPILTSVGVDTKSQNFFYIDPASGVSSVVGEVWKNVTGRGVQSFAATSGPATFELEDNESEAVFRARVIGPGAVDPSKLTNVELAECILLWARTVLVDYLMPLIGTANGIAANSAIVQDDLVTIIMVDIPKIVPNFFESCMFGNFESAFMALIDGLASERGYELLAKLVKAIAKDKLGDGFEAAVQKGALILQGIDLALFFADYLRITNDIVNARGLEEWDFTVRASKVTLSPGESVVSIYAPSNKEEMEATVQNLSEAEAKKVVYRWTVQGKFGTLSDNQGHTGTSFESAQKKISFTSKNDPGLTDGDNWETVIVTAFLDGKEIGSDTARINVKKSRYEIQPGDVTLSGRVGQTNSVNLRLQPVGSGEPIGSNSDFDYKIVWETSGRHGGLVLPSGEHANNITTYNNNLMTYKCVDDAPKTSTETVTARIYAKKKGQPDTEYRLFDVVKVTIKIENDEKKKIMHIPLTCNHGDKLYNDDKAIICKITTYASFNAEKDAKSYRVRFYNVRWPASYSWNATGNQPQKVDDFVAAPQEGVFKVAYSSSWGDGPTWTLQEHRKCGEGPLGMAEVIITLK